MTKKELLYTLDNYWDYYQNKPIFGLIKKLVETTDENDVDFKEALNDGMAEEIINLFLDCYNDSDFMQWLNDNDFDLFNGYRFADRVYRNDYESDEDFIENSGAFYNGEPDCLMYNKETGCYVISW